MTWIRVTASVGKQTSGRPGRGSPRKSPSESSISCHALDVNEIAAGIDLNALMSRVDLDAILTKVDVDALLAGVDVNALLDRVDVNSLLDHVDVNDLVSAARRGRPGPEHGPGRGDSQVDRGHDDEPLDAARSQAVGLDQFVDRWVRRLIRRKQPWPEVPPPCFLRRPP